MSGNGYIVGNDRLSTKGFREDLDPNSFNEFGMPPLLVACQAMCLDEVRVILGRPQSNPWIEDKHRRNNALTMLASSIDNLRDYDYPGHIKGQLIKLSVLEAMEAYAIARGAPFDTNDRVVAMRRLEGLCTKKNGSMEIMFGGHVPTMSPQDQALHLVECAKNGTVLELLAGGDRAWQAAFPVAGAIPEPARPQSGDGDVRPVVFDRA